MTWNLQTGEEAQRIAGSMDAWEHVRADEKRAKAAAKGAGSPGTPERTTEEKKEGSDAMDVDGDEENAAAKDGDGDGSEDANDGDEEKKMNRRRRRRRTRAATATPSSASTF